MAPAGIARLGFLWRCLAGSNGEPAGYEEGGKGYTEEEDERCED